MGSTTNQPKNAAQKNTVPTWATENDRILVSARSKSGAGCVRDRCTNSHSSTAEPRTVSKVGTLTKPQLSVCAIASTSRPTPIEAIGTLIGSTRSGRSSDRDSWRMAAPAAIASTATGTFTRNTERQPNALMRIAPIVGPSAAASAPVAPQMPTAMPRRSGGNAGKSNARPAGNCIAPPTDCSTREAISVDGSTLSPDANEPIMNTNKPARNSFLRP